MGKETYKVPENIEYLSLVVSGEPTEPWAPELEWNAKPEDI